MVFALRNCNPRFERRIPFGQLCRLFLHLSVLVMNLGIKAFEYSIFLNHQFIRFLGSLLCLDKLPFSLLLLSNVRHHRDRTTTRGPDGGECEAIARPACGPQNSCPMDCADSRPVRPLGRPHPWAVITVDSQISQKVW